MHYSKIYQQRTLLITVLKDLFFLRELQFLQKNLEVRRVRLKKKCPNDFSIKYLGRIQMINVRTFFGHDTYLLSELVQQNYLVQCALFKKKHLQFY